MIKVIRKLGIMILVIFVLSSCMTSTSKKSSNDDKVLLETREKIDELVFSQDDNEIYQYLFLVILQNNKTRIESGKNDKGEYITKEISTNKIVLDDYTSIHLSANRTYNDNLQNGKVFLEKEKGNVYHENFDDFAIKNKNQYSLSNLINKYDYVESYSKIQSLMSPKEKPLDYWDRFYKTIPTACGNMTLSRIGYNKESTTAMIEAKYMKSGMNGFVDYIFLNKTDGKWDVVDSIRIIFY